MGKIREVICKKCGAKFEARRSDAKHCEDCHEKRRKAWQASPHGRGRRADIYKKLRQSVIVGYGGECQCCKERREEFLAIDHVKGGGGKERKVRSIQQIATKIVKNNFPPEYRILCHNCNLSLGFYGYCPHNKRTA